MNPESFALFLFVIFTFTMHLRLDVGVAKLNIFTVLSLSKRVLMSSFILFLFFLLFSYKTKNDWVLHTNKKSSLNSFKQKILKIDSAAETVAIELAFKIFIYWLLWFLFYYLLLFYFFSLV